MLSEQEIKQALRADRVLPVTVANPHGPFGLEQLARAVADFSNRKGSHEKSLVRSLEVPDETWQKLERLANEATRNSTRTVSVSEVAAAILQHYVGGDR